jgi:hypothetical protein
VTTGRRLRAIWFAAAALALAAIAAMSPRPDRVTDRGTYEKTAAQVIVPDCTDIHCFRVLVPWVLGRLPGPSTAKWKLYAAGANAGASVAVFELSLLLGLSRRGAALAAVASASGFGGLYTLCDPFTADPLMYLLGPVLTIELLRDRVAAAGLIASIGVLGKEFAAAPLYLFAAYRALGGDAVRALRSLLAANSAFTVWLALQLTLMLAFNYGYGGNPSTDLSGGGYLRPWLDTIGPRGAASAMLNEYSAFYLLAPAGLFFAGRRLRGLALTALPIALLFAYVQQPDRALWNFHFLVVPLGALVLERTAPALAWTTVALFALVNLKVGAQLPWMPPARFTLPLVLLAAAASIGAAAVSSRRAQPMPASA